MTLRQILIACFLLLWPLQALAQTATLLADFAEIKGDTTIVATGNVEVLYGDTRLQAQEITYNQKTDVLNITGPITISNAEGTVILADSASLSTDLQNGIITSARMVMDQQLQMAATEIARVEGRYTQLYKTSATSCQVCGKNQVPLWKIRSKKVVHDEQEQQLYFQDAIFELAGVPVAYIPRLRMPDPTLKRATGFLVPEYRGSSLLGNGLAIPYFVALGDHADVTVTPYIARETKTVELRFRRAFRTGEVEFNGAVSKDTLRPNDLRGYLFGTGKFDLPQDFNLSFDVQLTSDIRYLRDYDYSNKDRLESNIEIDRTRNNTYISGSVIVFKPLRGVELALEDELPNIQGELEYEKRFYPAGIGGIASLEFNLQGYKRESTADQIGRDRTRFTTTAKWSRNYSFGPGILGRIGGKLIADFYYITDDSTYPEYQAFLTPAVEAELRWPLVKTASNGATMVLEPVIHVAWAGTPDANVPNEDSTLVEFDEGNLFSISRFPGYDDFEHGLRATAGVLWSRHDPKAWDVELAFGRVFRDKDLGQFSAGTGLDGKDSDWLIASRFHLNKNFSWLTRALIDDDLQSPKTETRLTWRQPDYAISTSYAWLVADPAEYRNSNTTQLTLDGAFNFARHWNSTLDWRYDFDAKKSAQAAVGVQYRNECISIDLSLSRRFRSSVSVQTETNVDFAVSLLGFGAGRRGPAHTCGG